jgi:Fe-S cluster assembly protein SufB
MFRISRRAEYGIIATQFMAKNREHLVSVKEIADSMNLSFDFLSKTLQALNKNGIVISQKGINGGYMLARPPESISLYEIIDTLEEKKAIVECLEPDSTDCDKSDFCEIKDPLVLIQSKIENLFSNITLAEIIAMENNKKVQLDLNKVNYAE